MKWSVEYSTGVPQLDEQHKRLFQMSDDYGKTLHEGRGERLYGLMLETLEQYARAHFGIEEECMYRHLCPAAQSNSEAHGQFVRALQEFQQRYAADGFDSGDALALVQYVDGWLVNHIGRIDTQLRPCVEPDRGS